MKYVLLGASMKSVERKKNISIASDIDDINILDVLFMLCTAHKVFNFDLPMRQFYVKLNFIESE